jgi:hypothetical protein
MAAKATFLIEPLVAARMALEWIQRHGSCPNDPRQASNPKYGDGIEWKLKQDVDFLRDA